MFLIFINDLPDFLCSKVRLFVDDTIAYRVAASNDDCIALQEDIDKMIEWEWKWGMEFHPEKCEILRVCGSKVPISYAYNKCINYIDRWIGGRYHDAK